MCDICEKLGPDAANMPRVGDETMELAKNLPGQYKVLIINSADRTGIAIDSCDRPQDLARTLRHAAGIMEATVNTAEVVARLGLSAMMAEELVKAFKKGKRGSGTDE